MHNIIALTAEGGTSLLDTEVVTFVTDAAKSIIEIMVTPPLGTFITIGIVGAVAGLVGTIVALARGRRR